MRDKNDVEYVTKEIQFKKRKKQEATYQLCHIFEDVVLKHTGAAATHRVQSWWETWWWREVELDTPEADTNHHKETIQTLLMRTSADNLPEIFIIIETRSEVKNWPR